MIKIYIYLTLFLTAKIGIYKFYTDTVLHEEEQMYNIIMTKGSIDKDLYNRTISNDVIKKFCKIARKYSININTLTDDEFNFIYKKYVKYIIKKYDKQ